MRHLIALVVASMCVGGSLVSAQQPKAAQPAADPTATGGVATPEDYVIGPEDVLVVTFWRDDTMSGETLVRPDGKITLRLLGDILAGGLTTPQLGEVLRKAAAKYLEDATVTVVVKQINSRRVTVIGEVARQGEFKLNGPMTVLQAIGQAGGVTEYADKANISVIRTVNGVPKALPFDYEAIMRGRKLEQDIPLKPGDKVVVPE
jgi:polysaccharide export outer membrane protein